MCFITLANAGIRASEADTGENRASEEVLNSPAVSKQIRHLVFVTRKTSVLQQERCAVRPCFFRVFLKAFEQCAAINEFPADVAGAASGCCEVAKTRIEVRRSLLWSRPPHPD